MPQPWTISTPSASQYQRISEAGGAEPPQVTRLSLDRSKRPGSASTTAFTPCQIVGTPADRLTSSSAMSCASRCGSMNRWGITCLQPKVSASQGRPQPMA